MKSHKLNTHTVYVLLALLALGPAVQAIPSDPNNAALLYYQAFISLPTDQDQVRGLLEDLPYGVDPNGQIREYLKQCRPAIDLAVAASVIPACDWGLRYSQGSQVPLGHLTQIRHLAFLLRDDSKVLVTDGRYRIALERCLTIRRMAQHVGDEIVISFLVSTAINGLGDKAIRNTLGAMPPDEQILVWLKKQLAVIPNRDLPIKNALRGDEKLWFAEKLAGNDRLIEAAKSSENITPSQVEILKKADEAFFEASHMYFKTYTNAVLAVLDSPIHYVQKFSQLEELDRRPVLDAKSDPNAILTAMGAPAHAKLLTLDMRAKASDNILKAAVEVYLVKARTGSIPDRLPPGMPKDPLTGQDFKYEKTQEGFSLTRWTDDPTKDKTYQFTFKVR